MVGFPFSSNFHKFSFLTETQSFLCMHACRVRLESLTMGPYLSVLVTVTEQLAGVSGSGFVAPTLPIRVLFLSYESWGLCSRVWGD